MKKNITIQCRILFSIVVLFFCINGCEKIQTSESNNKKLEIEKIDKLLEDGKPVYSLDEAHDIVNDLIPIVENFAEKKFKKIPKIRLIDTDEAKKILSRENNNNLKNTLYQYSDDENIQNKMLSKMVLGIYGKYDQILYLLPQRIAVALRLNKIDEKYALDIAKMNIAHELTHALQDQYISLKKQLNKIPGKEGTHAFLATIEGHATFIEKKVANHLGIDKSIAEAKHSVNYSGNNSIDSSIKSSSKNRKSIRMMKILPLLHMIYSQGEQFIRYHYTEGGNEKIWSILKNPPIDTSMVSYPETYSPKPYDDFDYKSLMLNLYDYRKHDETTEKLGLIYKNYSVSKFDLNLIFKKIDCVNKKLIISKLQHYQSFTVSYRAKPLSQIGFINLKENQQAYSFSSLMKEHIKQLYEINKSWKDMPISKSFVDSIDDAKKISVVEKVQTKKMGEVIVTHTYALICKDNLIVFYNDVLFSLTNYQIQNIATEIFSRYNNAKRKEMFINESKSD